MKENNKTDSDSVWDFQSYMAYKLWQHHLIKHIKTLNDELDMVNKIISDIELKVLNNLNKPEVCL